MSPGRLQRAFILHRRNYSDTSLLLEIFAAEQGRLPLLAKGARRGRAPQAALLQPFHPLWLAWSGRGEVRTLTGAEAAGRPIALSGTALYCGLYVNELVMRLIGRSDPHEELFVSYQVALARLGGVGSFDDTLRQFELRLLQEIGYQIVLDREADSGRPVRPDGRYVYVAQHGMVPSVSADGADGVQGETLCRLASGESLVGAHAREARTLMRKVLAPYLGERPLKSRELFRRPW